MPIGRLAKLIALKTGRKIVKAGKYIKRNPGEIATGAGIGVIGGAAAAQTSAGVKGAHDVYKQRRHEGEGKIGASLRSVSPLHTYAGGKRIARYDKRVLGRKKKTWKGLGKAASYHSIAGAGYLAEYNKNKVRRVKK